ncbi:hypothetical protein LCGC14_2024440, partial [marine sediment metagenome]
MKRLIVLTLIAMLVACFSAGTSFAQDSQQTKWTPEA